MQREAKMVGLGFDAALIPESRSVLGLGAATKSGTSASHLSILRVLLISTSASTTAMPLKTFGHIAYYS